MKTKIIIVLKQCFFFFFMMFISIMTGAIVAAWQIGKSTLETAEFLRNIYLKESLKIGCKLGIIFEIILFVFFYILELKKENKK